MKEQIVAKHQFSFFGTNQYKQDTKNYFLISEVNADYFLSIICKHGTLWPAIYKCRLNLLEVRQLLDDDEHFKKSVEAAKSVAVDVAESELYERAVEGYTEIRKNKKGEVVSTVHKKSDRCLLEYLKNYREKQPNANNNIKPEPILKDGGSIPTKRFPVDGD